MPAADTPPPAVAATSRLGTLPAFAYDSLDERPVVSEAFRGKPLVLGFFTSWDLASQAQARVLLQLAKLHPSRELHIAMVAIEESKNRELVEAYRASLGLPFPVALVDPQAMAQSNSFAGMRVPAVYVFDANGKVVFERSVLTSLSELRSAVAPLIAAH